MNNKYKIILPNKNYLIGIKFFYDIDIFKNGSLNIFIYSIKFLFIFLLILQIKFLENEKLPAFKNNTKKIIQNNITKNNKSRPKLFFNTTFLKNELHSYGLYKVFKCPFISIILIVKEKIHFNIIQLMNQIKYITSQNFSNIEILINLVKGLYIIFIENVNLLKSLNINYFYNITKGKIDNYFKFNITQQENLYLIKSKTLKNIIDNGMEIISFDMMLNAIKSIKISEPSFPKSPVKM